jgi:hypothetical protein
MPECNNCHKAIKKVSPYPSSSGLVGEIYTITVKVRLIKNQGLAAGPEVNRQLRGEQSRLALNSRLEVGEDPARFGSRRYGRPVGPAVRQVRVTVKAGGKRMRAEASAG